MNWARIHRLQEGFAQAAVEGGGLRYQLFVEIEEKSFTLKCIESADI